MGLDLGTFGVLLGRNGLGARQRGLVDCVLVLRRKVERVDLHGGNLDAQDARQHFGELALDLRDHRLTLFTGDLRDVVLGQHLAHDFVRQQDDVAVNVDVACFADFIEQVVSGAGRHPIGDTDPQRQFLRIPGERFLLGEFERVGRGADEVGVVDEGELQVKTWL